MLRYDISIRRLKVSLLTVVTFGMFTFAHQTKAQSVSKEYVVIGVFSIEKNAERLTAYANEKEISANYKIHPERDLFYVYEEVDNAWEERKRIKESFPEFYDVWVYEGALGRNPILASQEPKQKSTLIASNSVAEANSGVSDEELELEKVKMEDGEKNSAEKYNEEKLAASNDKVTVSNSDETEELVTIEPEENTYYLYFNTINSKNLKEVKGKVNVIDPVRAKQLKEAKSHKIVEVKDPNNGSKMVKLSANIFGFREVQQTITLDKPVNDTTSAYVHTIGDSIIVDFELERYKKGDVIVMYNVYFFKDAAIMKPESIYELNALLDMLKENENLVVKLHGHTNGNSHGKVLHLDLEDKNFFSLNANHKEDNGSAKKLSEYRAYTIQHWLMEQGIAEERIDIKGWGGKKMLFDKHDTQAFKNVRVEVEIVEE